MKIVTTLVFNLILISAFGQQKKDTKVIVHVDDTAGLVNRVALKLYEAGYSLEQKDIAAGFLATNEKDKGSRSFKIRALIKDSTITLTGLVANNVKMFANQQRTFTEVGFFGMKGSDMRLAWEELMNIANQFGPRIEYSK